MKLVSSFCLLISLASVSWGGEFEKFPSYTADNWYKGNTHTHTTNSDGDSPPDVVAAWYKDHGYDFLVLSDHNHLTDPAKAKVGDESFLLIPGEEVSSFQIQGVEKRKPIHLNALDIDELVEPVNDLETTAKTIQANVDAIRAADGVPHINHPNFRWAFSAPELLDVGNYKLLEVYNGHPLVNNEGDGDHIGMEMVWDTLLSEGRRIYGIGVDDAHHFKGEFAPKRSNPGRCWVMVKANSLETGEIMEALEAGEFYFTTGVVLSDIIIEGESYSLEWESENITRVEFIGSDGDILDEQSDSPAIYTLKGDELYIRAKIYDEAGNFAWTQPVFTTN